MPTHHDWLDGGTTSPEEAPAGEVPIPSPPADANARAAYLAAVRAYYEARRDDYRSQSAEYNYFIYTALPRRARMYASQDSSTVWLMWMVVLLTVCGVVFSGAQLWRSLHLAKTTADLPGDSELKASLKELSVRTSMAGILILTLSLAFFSLYVRYIYPIDVPGQTSGSTPPAQQR